MPTHHFARALAPCMLRPCSSQIGNRVMDSQVSGTTGLALLVDGDTLICANCGDCRAIVCSKDERSAGGVVARPLSVDHKPSRPDERARILNSPLAMVCSLSQVVPGESGSQLFVCRPAASRRPPRGARMGRKPSAPQLGDAVRGDADTGTDPSTIGLQGFTGAGRGAPFAGTQPSAAGIHEDEGDDVAIQYAVMFTRSMGDADAHANLGVIAEPEVRASRLRPGKELFFVLATDGVWDTMSNEQVADCVSHSTGPQAAAEAVIARARWAWSMRSGERKDDITCIVVWLRWMDESEARRESRLRERRIREEAELAQARLDSPSAEMSPPAAHAGLGHELGLEARRRGLERTSASAHPSPLARADTASLPQRHRSSSAGIIGHRRDSNPATSTRQGARRASVHGNVPAVQVALPTPAFAQEVAAGSSAAVLQASEVLAARWNAQLQSSDDGARAAGSSATPAASVAGRARAISEVSKEASDGTKSPLDIQSVELAPARPGEAAPPGPSAHRGTSVSEAKSGPESEVDHLAARERRQGRRVSEVQGLTSQSLWLAASASHGKRAHVQSGGGEARRPFQRPPQSDPPADLESSASLQASTSASPRGEQSQETNRAAHSPIARFGDLADEERSDPGKAVEVSAGSLPTRQHELAPSTPQYSAGRSPRASRPTAAGTASRRRRWSERPPESRSPASDTHSRRHRLQNGPE